MSGAVQSRFVEAGGLRMHFVEAGEGPPVVLLHGWPQHWYLWRGVIPLLAPRRRVICPDLRGFGWTDVPRSGYDRETMARDVLALLDELGLEQFDVVGHDWGGWIGFLLGLRHPDRVRRFLALGVVPPWPSRNPRSLLEIWRLAYQIPLAFPMLGRLLVQHGLARRMLRSGDALSDAEIQAFTDRLRGERARASELLYRTFLLREAGPVAAGRYERLLPLEVPTLLVYGERDPVAPTRVVREQAAREDSLELEMVPGAGHFVVDEKPDLVAERALSFLAA